jgi:hypothetical protein
VDPTTNKDRYIFVLAKFESVFSHYADRVTSNPSIFILVSYRPCAPTMLNLGLCIGAFEVPVFLGHGAPSLGDFFSTFRGHCFVSKDGAQITPSRGAIFHVHITMDYKQEPLHAVQSDT